MPSQISSDVRRAPAVDPRFRPGASITDGNHLYWVQRATVTPMSQQATVLVVEDCKSNVLLELDLARVASTCTLIRSPSSA